MSNVPKLRFKEFGGDWEEKKLGEISSIKTGNKDTQNKVSDGLYPFFVRSNTIERINSYSFDGEAILTAGDGVGVGKVFHYLNEKFDYHQRVYNIHNFHKDISGKYIFFYFSDKFNKRIMKLSAKNSVDSVRMEMISNMEIPLPSKQEQEKIASFLTSVDTKIEQLTKKEALLKEYKKGLMNKIFNQEIRFKDDHGREFPEWENKEIGNILKIGSGKDYKHLSDGNIPVYGTGGYMTSVNEYLYNGESVCIGRKGTIDKPVFLSGKFWTVDTLFYTHSFKDSIPKFVFSIFQTINWKLYNEASGVPSLSKSTIEKIKITIPSIQEQTKIANFLSSIDKKIELTTKELNSTKEFKKALLQQMFI